MKITASEISLKTKIYFINKETERGGELTVKSISVFSEDKVELHIGIDIFFLYLTDDVWTKEPSDYFLNKEDWYKVFCPIQTKRVSKLENELFGARLFLEEIEKNLVK
jgi:hypothetical protein